MMANALELSKPDRRLVWRMLVDAVEEYLADVDELPAARRISADEVRRTLDRFRFDEPMDPVDAVRLAVSGLRTLQPHVRHPGHFGLFDAAPTTMAVVGDALAAAFNPCLASWAGSPFGVATERRLTNCFGRRFGYPEGSVDGILTTGGSEANHVAVLTALTARYPELRTVGLRGITEQPVVYLTDEAHPSLPRAAILAGLGRDAIRWVPVDAALRMDLAALDEQIRADRAAGLAPLLVAVTAGTTGAGVVDPLSGAAEIAERHGMWLHVDAAWGGAAAMLPELRTTFAGIERADSLTFDPHKWMSVPIGAGMFLTRRVGLLAETFHVGAGFLSVEDRNTLDPSMRSARWSRGFAGLKILLSLSVAGWRGYESVWRGQIALGERLRTALRAHGWRILNDTPLPVVCFGADTIGPPDGDRALLTSVAQAVNDSGHARIFRVDIGGRPALRAAVTNYGTGPDDIDRLVDLLDMARSTVQAATGHRPTLPDTGLCEARCVTRQSADSAIS